jgi:hypothetical protein
MLSPIIDKHVYDGTTIVRITCISAGTTVIVRSNRDRHEPPIAQQSVGGELIIDMGRNLREGEVLTAVARIGSEQSSPSEEVTVLHTPEPMPFPLTETTLYIGGIGIGAWGVLPGSMVKVISAVEELGNAMASRGYITMGLRPLTGSDAVQLQSYLGRHTSGKTPAINPVMPHGTGPYAEKLPPPTVKRPNACQQVVGLNGTLPGVRIQVFVRGKNESDPGSIAFDMFAPWLSPNCKLGQVLQEGDLVRARQMFESLSLKSEIGPGAFANKPNPPNAPEIVAYVWEGDRRVVLSRLLDSAQIEIAVNGSSLGIVDFTEEFDVGIPLVAGQSVKARQRLCGIWSDWCEVNVHPRPATLRAPVIEEPLYGCANIVRIAEKVQGALVEVYVDDVYAGESKSLHVSVIPHLVPRQSVTAIQRCGDVVSARSQPVIVQDVRDAPPAPVLEMADPRFVEVSHLIPGAHVNVLWGTFIIASIEATQEKETIWLPIEPWPGEDICAIQSVCMKPGPKSNAATVVGRIHLRRVKSDGSLDTWESYVRIHDKLQFTATTQWPVKADTKVRIIPSDPAVVKVVGAIEAIIPAGKTDATFQLEAVSTGVACLELQADHYKQVLTTWDFELDNRFWVLVQGVIALNPSSKILESEETFNLTVTADPRPPDGEVCLTGWEGTKVIVILAGQISYTVALPGQKNDQNYNFKYDVWGTRDRPWPPPPGWQDDLIADRSGTLWPRYVAGECTVIVEPAPAPPPKRTLPPPLSTFQVTLVWDKCTNYKMDMDSDKAHLKGTLHSIKNLTLHTLHIFRPSGFNVPTGEPIFNVTVPPNDTSSNLSIQSQDILNLWGATITDLDCNDMLPSDVSFTINVTLA